MKHIAWLLLLFLSYRLTAQSADEKQILETLKQQTISWNNGDLNEFMKGYWNNDSLMFISSSGITYGYANTLERYKKTYSDASKMGKLFFEIVKVKKISPEYYFVVGKWFLRRSAGDIGGMYTLMFRKIKGKWLIIADHSS
jgi:hypothetical protein